MKFEYDKNLAKLRIAYEIVTESLAEDSDDELMTSYEKLYEAVGNLLVAEKTKEERVELLAKFGFTRKEAKKYKDGYALIIDGSVMRDDPDCDQRPIIERDIKDIKVFWIDDLPMSIQENSETWEILDMSKVKVISHGLIKDGSVGKKNMDEV